MGARSPQPGVCQVPGQRSCGRRKMLCSLAGWAACGEGQTRFAEGSVSENVQGWAELPHSGTSRRGLFTFVWWTVALLVPVKTVTQDSVLPPVTTGGSSIHFLRRLCAIQFFVFISGELSLKGPKGNRGGGIILLKVKAYPASREVQVPQSREKLAKEKRMRALRRVEDARKYLQ
uniref:Uncharacterized protein n=1 Tax=Anopheles atroparvus TaxID=41427 RepID=A0A182IRR5_ANOAO